MSEFVILPLPEILKPLSPPLFPWPRLLLPDCPEVLASPGFPPRPKPHAHIHSLGNFICSQPFSITCKLMPPKAASWAWPRPEFQPHVSIRQTLHPGNVLPPAPPLEPFISVGRNSQSVNYVHVTLEILSTLSLPPVPATVGLLPAPHLGHYSTSLLTALPVLCPVPSNPTPLSTRQAVRDNRTMSFHCLKLLPDCQTGRAPCTPSMTWILPVIALLFSHFIRDDTQLLTAPHTIPCF